MLYPLIVLGGLILGLLVGRWWTLAAAVGIGAYITVISEVYEVPGWFLGAAYAALAGVGIAVGAAVRTRLRRR